MEEIRKSGLWSCFVISSIYYGYRYVYWRHGIGDVKRGTRNSLTWSPSHHIFWPIGYYLWSLYVSHFRQSFSHQVSNTLCLDGWWRCAKTNLCSWVDERKLCVKIIFASKNPCNKGLRIRQVEKYTGKNVYSSYLHTHILIHISSFTYLHTQHVGLVLPFFIWNWKWQDEPSTIKQQHHILRSAQHYPVSPKTPTSWLSATKLFNKMISPA